MTSSKGVKRPDFLTNKETLISLKSYTHQKGCRKKGRPLSIPQEVGKRVVCYGKAHRCFEITHYSDKAIVLPRSVYAAVQSEE